MNLQVVRVRERRGTGCISFAENGIGVIDTHLDGSRYTVWGIVEYGYKYLSDFCNPYLFVLMTMRMIEEGVEGWDSFLSPTCKKAVKGVQWRGGMVVVEGVEDVGSLVHKMQWGQMSYHATDGGWARHVSGHGGGVWYGRSVGHVGGVVGSSRVVERAYWLLSADRAHRKALEVAEQAYMMRMVADGSCEALGLREWLAVKYGGLRMERTYDDVGERCDAWEGSSRGSVNADVQIFRSRIPLEFHIRIPHGTYIGCASQTLWMQ
ncbi:hypothetical protein F5887DRAFT_925384 [Amanita rubescens]|nr:hypothetical protein F5887DRAFT_925384 [Amanita rubescens]